MKHVKLFFEHVADFPDKAESEDHSEFLDKVCNMLKGENIATFAFSTDRPTVIVSRMGMETLGKALDKEQTVKLLHQEVDDDLDFDSDENTKISFYDFKVPEKLKKFAEMNGLRICIAIGAMYTEVKQIEVYLQFIESSDLKHKYRGHITSQKFKF